MISAERAVEVTRRDMDGRAIVVHGTVAVSDRASEFRGEGESALSVLLHGRFSNSRRRKNAGGAIFTRFFISVY